MAELLGATYSPWTERARWALDLRRVPYRFRQYVPMVGELALRRKLGRWRGPVSVPVLTTDEGVVIPDSTAIARWADGHGQGPRLFPAGQDAVIDRWVVRADDGLGAGRALSLARILGDREAMAELVPRGVRKVLGPLAASVGKLGILRTRKKYGGGRASLAEHAAVLDGVLDELRAALAGRATLLATLSYADLAVAQVLAYVQPPATGLRLGKASGPLYGDPALAARYPELVAWRDALYAAHRSA
jgi:glutathione S-transferase